MFFSELDGDAHTKDKIVTLLAQSSKAATTQCLWICTRTDKNEGNIKKKCLLGYNHSERCGGCLCMEDLICSEEEGGLSTNAKLQVAKFVIRPGAHEAKFVEWIALYNCLRKDCPLVSRLTRARTRPTIAQLRTWYPAPAPRGHPGTPVALVLSAPQPLPVRLDAVVNIPPPSLHPVGSALPSLREALCGNGSSALPPPPVGAVDVVAAEEMDSDFEGGFDSGNHAAFEDDEWEEGQEEDSVDPRKSVSQLNTIEIKEEWSAAKLSADDYKACFELLGLNKNASLSAIKKAYFDLARQVHPDKVSDDAKEEAEIRFRLLSQCFNLAYTMRERDNGSLSARREREKVEMSLLSFVSAADGEADLPFKEGGTFNQGDISTDGALPGIYKGEDLTGRVRTSMIALVQILHVEALHELGWQYYYDPQTKVGYETKYHTHGEWIVDMVTFFSDAVVKEDRGIAIGTHLTSTEMHGICPVKETDNKVYTMLKFFLSPMDPKNSWYFATTNEINDDTWADNVEVEPVFEALCWLIGGAPKQLSQHHPMFRYLVEFSTESDNMKLLTGGGWTTKLIDKEPSSPEVKELEKKISDYWKNINDEYTFYILPEVGMNSFGVLMAGADHSDHVKYAQEKGHAYSEALKGLESSAKRQRTIAATTTPSSPADVGRLSVSQQCLLGLGLSVATPMVIDDDNED
jgi:hypothetical protein